jgi:thymidylate synthase
MIPVLNVSGVGIARAWERSLIELYSKGCELETEYDKPGDPPSKDATMLITIEQPLSEPMIHRDMPGGLEDLQEYVMEVCDGIKDHLIRDPEDPSDKRWEYTYHQRLFEYTSHGFNPFKGTIAVECDQIEVMCQKLAVSPHTRRAQAITWKVWEDNDCYDPACLQSVWCRILNGKLCMNVRFRSNDAYKAAFMNIFALVQLQKLITDRVAELSGMPLEVGRYCHIADSYHIYGSNMDEFENRFLGAYQTRGFMDRTFEYLTFAKPIMDEAKPGILKKVEEMGR